MEAQCSIVTGRILAFFIPPSCVLLTSRGPQHLPGPLSKTGKFLLEVPEVKVNWGCEGDNAGAQT
jgi:hypothetical protein